MEALLQKAIEINSTTILPNFGAFMKMGNSILFNEFLKYDDGKLAKVIADLEKISEDDAKVKITAWIELTLKKLEGGESISIPNVGTLVRESGKLKFTASTVSETSVAKPIVTTEIKEEPKPVVVEEKPKVEEVKEIVKEEDVIEVSKPVVKPVAKVINISTDFSAQEAIDKIKDYTNKNDLIAFTRDDKRKTVIDALNKKLDTLNGKIVAPAKEEKVEEPIKPIITEKVVEKEKVTLESPIKEKVEEVIKEKEPKIEVPPLVEKEKVVPPVVEAKATPEVPEVKKPEVKKEAVTPIVTPKVEPKVEKKPVPDKKDNEKAIAAIASGVEKTEQQLKKRKRRKLILWLAIICLLIGGGTIGFLKKDVIMAYFDKKHEPKELADNTAEHKEEGAEDIVNKEHASDTIDDAKETIIVEEPVKEEVEETDPVKEIKEVEEEVEPVVTKPTTSGNYHIVAGSFSSEDNAANKVESLKSKGYSSAKVLGKYGGLYTVSAMSFSSSSEAKSSLANFKSEGNKGFVKKL